MDQASIRAITGRAAKGDKVDSAPYRTTANVIVHVGEGAEESLARIGGSRGESARGKGEIYNSFESSYFRKLKRAFLRTTL